MTEEVLSKMAKRQPIGGQPGPLAAGPSPRAPSSKRKRTPIRRLGYRLAVPGARLLIRALRLCHRSVHVIGQENFDAWIGSGKPCVLTYWHAHALVCTTHLLKLSPPETSLTFMVSPSVDGDPVSSLLEREGAQVIRGSATRSGVASLKHIYRALSKGGTPVVAPDGPQGPPHVFKPGAVLLSQMAGVPVLPMACAVDRRWHLNNWDRMVVPKPMARVVLAFGEPQFAPKEFDNAGLAASCDSLGRQLDELSQRARQMIEGR
jgi:lysophospholipid acyltransferase (LPLAT)-like uncharacterized protein